ncbi:7-cyano-7-deazaguanine synthase QueC [Halodesulfovibrio marinisediminis]|uniref:7-cyano-7-deazaguanine synthase n=1 Tax=Halodesulfovibrio marinisediminis DSM 17456 TaxID=1121457 RepID=A0A1N6I872_9BACT|nr:7-cyano-7-deazaguanine synthase QueC [Halodesulfovibrio marinisediminis]SIO28217.1 7-cyano-7-deazaguanine synthase [Halodesulfovibrio marinisediminis DSM 17456]
MNNSALVVFSGGQDSTTCLAWALERFDSVATIGFSYGQRHDVEMDCRKNVLSEVCGLNDTWKQRLKHDEVLEINLFNEIGGTALTEEVEIQMGENGLPTTFVPGRNLVFLTAAAAYAYRQGIRHIVIGVCETDFSGYPDCRDDTVKAMQVALNLGMESRFVIHTPLMWIDKAATWTMADDLGGKPFVDLVREHTHTCYLGDRTELHAWGYGCGTCPACELRAKGWEQFEEGKQ